MFVYKITNLENGKVYIGQTIRPIDQRFRRHLNDAINNIIDTHFARAIRKYGPESFYIELIDTASTQEELNYKEWCWIKYYNSDIIGYNETDNMTKCGGNTYQNKSNLELSLIKEKISKSKIGINNPNHVPVKCLNVITNEEIFFKTMVDCQSYFNMNNHNFITRRCNGTIRKLFNDEWQFAYLDSEYLAYDEKQTRSGCSVNVIDSKKFSEYNFNSIREASKILNIPRNKFKNNTEFWYNEFRVKVIKDKSVSTIPDECMEVGLEIGTSDVLGNEASENRSGRQKINH